MKQFVKAFAPGNISCIFTICEDTNPEKMGSRGIGFTLNKGVTVTVFPTSTTQILFNGHPIIFPTVLSVVERLAIANVTIAITTSLPLGGGFGLSGASALSTAYALNDLFQLSCDNLSLAKIAHIAEVQNKTGLGDVTNQYFGGCILKNESSAQFIIQRIPLTNTTIYCRSISELSTKSILTNKSLKARIDQAGEAALQEIMHLIHAKKEVLLQDIFYISRKFADTSGLLHDSIVRSTIESIERVGGHASMIMLGNAVMSDIYFPLSEMFTISQVPAHLLNQ